MPRVKQAPVKGWPYSPRHHLLVRRNWNKKEEEEEDEVEEEKDEEIRINALFKDDPEETVSSHPVLSDLIAFI
jgi:hypothetical protein